MRQSKTGSIVSLVFGLFSSGTWFMKILIQSELNPKWNYLFTKDWNLLVQLLQCINQTYNDQTNYFNRGQNYAQCLNKNGNDCGHKGNKHAQKMAVMIVASDYTFNLFWRIEPSWL